MAATSDTKRRPNLFASCGKPAEVGRIAWEWLNREKSPAQAAGRKTRHKKGEMMGLEWIAKRLKLIGAEKKRRNMCRCCEGSV
ncbi:hypothetical protein L596_015814 [Steinernema carpocapsae]|uniref:Uncharacterized protein n=1 Tax=Steinernema carpocapsae TaxID=34508 RepID=A0A4U5NGY7_STECR|nr:hypothetical protein L596_015814 [Steinernema carpocapsae]